MWQEPWRSRWAALAATALLMLRKPWALTTPQLWAEDGPIHLADVDSWGAHACLVPYRGYLHLLPRLIAWLASRIADVAYAPAIYNTCALLVAAALFVRVASPRLTLPGKPWLILAFVLAAHTGEVWLNITNLHWLTAFFLLLQTLIDRPTTAWQRVGDLALLVVVGLTGPFVIVFLPLFAWRWWRERNGDTRAMLLLAIACAAVQIYFLETTGLKAPGQPWRLDLLLAIIGSRLAVWPLFGSAIAESLSWPALGAIGLMFIVALLAWALRRDSRRPLRAPIVVAFLAIATVCIARVRPDTWAYPDLVNGDSYFYIARVLLLWLLIWEFDAQFRPVAAAARTLGLLALIMQLPDFRLPAPPDYEWAAYCETIRRGDPAKIPILPPGFIFEYLGRPRGAKPRATDVLPLDDVPRNSGRLARFAVRTEFAAPDADLTIGLGVGGVGTHGVKPLLVRALGPSTVNLGVTRPLPDPRLAILQGENELADNDNWGERGAAASLSALFAKIGASTLAENSRDAALLFRPAVASFGSYTIVVRGNGGVGTALAEVYDATDRDAFTRVTPRLVNFSVLTASRPDETLRVEFTVAGATARRVLVRAIGPSLGTVFKLSDAVARPSIEVFDDRNARIASNHGWGDAEGLADVFREVGAFRLRLGSQDAALVRAFAPGRYHVELRNQDKAGGRLLVEIYEAP